MTEKQPTIRAIVSPDASRTECHAKPGRPSIPTRVNHSREIRYRADIDGLRAIAVLLVVGFHMKVGFVSSSVQHWIGQHISNTAGFWLAQGPQGGFVGVDVFFVISGFLISGILLREQSTGTFSIIRFYERRVRRILPALLGILLFVFLVACFTFTPAEIVSLAKSTLAATFSTANIYFWRTSGYFEALSYPKPLLHTWSLAVEEQFYLLFPLFLLLVHRSFRKYLKSTVVMLAIVSFAASAISTQRYPNAAFYLPHTRAWELLLGTILAMGIIPPPSSGLARNLIALAGLALILFSGCRFDESITFPGTSPLLPAWVPRWSFWRGRPAPHLSVAFFPPNPSCSSVSSPIRCTYGIGLSCCSTNTNICRGFALRISGCFW